MSSAGDFAKKVYDTLSQMLSDLSSLEVTTSTIDPTGAATVRARTTIAADGDTRFEIPVDAQGAIDTTLLAQHQSAVDKARAERKATWDQIMRVVDGAISVEKKELETQ